MIPFLYIFLRLLLLKTSSAQALDFFSSSGTWNISGDNSQLRYPLTYLNSNTGNLMGQITFQPEQYLEVQFFIMKDTKYPDKGSLSLYGRWHLEYMKLGRQASFPRQLYEMKTVLAVIEEGSKRDEFLIETVLKFDKNSINYDGTPFNLSFMILLGSPVITDEKVMLNGMSLHAELAIALQNGFEYWLVAVLVVLVQIVKIISCFRLNQLFTFSVDSHNRVSLLTLMMITLWDIFFISMFSELCAFKKFGIFRFAIYLLHTFIMFYDGLKLVGNVVHQRLEESYSPIVDYEKDIFFSKNWIRYYLLCFFGLVFVLLLQGASNLKAERIFFLSFVFIPQIINNANNNKFPFEGSNYLITSSLYGLLMIGFRVIPNDICILDPKTDICLKSLALIIAQIVLLLKQRLYSNDAFVSKSNEYQMSECSICLGELSEKPKGVRKSIVSPNWGLAYETSCHHCFHIACILDWMLIKKQCPICRKAIFITRTTYIQIQLITYSYCIL